MNAMGIRDKNLELIKHWLTKRVQRVKVNNSLSDWEDVISGIPQGSVLGPLAFLLFIWDLKLNDNDLSDKEVISKILKYVDDTKLISRVTNIDDIEIIQSRLNKIYQWEQDNNMLWNAKKFNQLRIGSHEIIENTYMFTPNYEDPIPEVNSVKDLGIYIDNDMSFKSHIDQVISKTNNKCSWLLRTFYTREISIMRMLYKTLAQPHIDYGALLWYPTGNVGQMGAIEGPLRAFTPRMKGCNNMNYWQRLKHTGMNSCERRIERFKLLYMWKVIQGHVPSLGFSIQNDTRRGRMIITDKPTGKVRSIRTLKEKSLQIEGPRIF